jgi:PAS domain S-box-containing protein
VQDAGSVRGARSPEVPKPAIAHLPPEEIEVLEGKAAVVHDELGCLCYVSPRFERLVGWDCRERLGIEGPHPWWPPEQLPRARRVRRHYASGEAMRRGEPLVRTRLIASSGEPIPVHAEYRAIAGDEGTPVFHVLVMHPVRPADELRIEEPVDEREERAPLTRPDEKALRWLTTPLVSAPVSEPGRRKAGYLLRKVQRGETLWRTESRPLPAIGKACREVQIRDPEVKATWRIICRVRKAELVVIGWHDRSSIPAEVADACRRRLREYVDQRIR